MSIRDLKNLKSDPTDLNILVISPTGVGKSTLINSIKLYRSFDRFAEAEKAKIFDFNLIPTDYVRYDDNFEKISIKIGQNENCQPGQSHTVKPKHYSFAYKEGRTVTFIDTPGIADTGSVKNDVNNMQAIINSIKGFSHINLIVFLLKPNESRLTEEFVFCFKELIKQFHRNAATNIAFAFTNSVNTHFKPGNTIGPLNELLNDIKEERDIDIPLNKNTMYFFDNESYEYFCFKATTDRITFSNEEIKSYKNSYDKSRNELLRILEHAENVTPHNPQESVNLNLTRNIVLKISKHLPAILNAVRQTMEKIKEREAIIKQFEGREDELEERLRYPVTIFHCNDQMKNVKKNKSDLEAQILKEKIFKDEINKELDTILKACAKFAAYLKKNSIVEYNDATDEYLRIAMNNEEKKNGKRSAHYQSLSQMLKEYDEEKEILEKTYNTFEGSGDIMLEDVQQIIAELCNLKYYGKYIASALETFLSEEENSIAKNFVKVCLR